MFPAHSPAKDAKADWTIVRNEFFHLKEEDERRVHSGDCPLYTSRQELGEAAIGRAGGMPQWMPRCVAGMTEYLYMHSDGAPSGGTWMYQNWGDADCTAGGHGDGYWFIRDLTFSLTLVNGRCELGAELIGQFPDWDTLQEREREAYRADSANLQLRYREIIGAD